MKKYYILSNKILRTLYNFDSKSEKHNNFTINELRMLVYLTEYRDSYSEITKRYSEIKNAVYGESINKPTFAKVLKTFEWVKDTNTGLYKIKLESVWRVDMTAKDKVKYSPYNTVENKHNTNSYSRLPTNVWNILTKSQDWNFYKLTFFILYKTHTDPHNEYRYTIYELYNKLNIKQPTKGHKREYLTKLQNYLDILYNANFIGNNGLLGDTIVIYKNKQYTENKTKKPIMIVEKTVIEKTIEPKAKPIIEYSPNTDDMEDITIQMDMDLDDVNNSGTLMEPFRYSNGTI